MSTLPKPAQRGFELGSPPELDVHFFCSANLAEAEPGRTAPTARSSGVGVVWLWLWLLAILVAVPLLALAGEWIHIAGLDGVRASVAIAADPSRRLSLAEVIERDAFEDLTHRPRRSVRTVVTFWRIDLETPESRHGKLAWLRITPPLIWDVDLLTVDGGRQHGGMVFPQTQDGRPGFPAQFGCS